MSESLGAVFFAASLPIFVLGLLKLAYYPLALAFEARSGRRTAPVSGRVWVSVIVPAYNEGRVLRNCIDSILADDYPRKEIILVDDGSTDDSLQVMRGYEAVPNVRVIAKANGGKASALNAGIRASSGRILMFVDADGIFTGQTIRRMVAAFDSRDVGAVCGNDEPVNLNNPQTHLLALLTHVGTGFVRRALSLINCMPVVSGNLGAFRREVVVNAGGFTEGFIGEDLELTWRIHRAGYRVRFCPRATVYAEVPSTIPALWKQRVRWTRGLAGTTRMHWDMMFRSRYGPIGWYLPINVASMLVVPVLQLVAMLLIPGLVMLGFSPVRGDVLVTLGWLGMLSGFVAAAVSIILDRAWRDLKYLYTVPLWAVYSLLMSAVTVWALTCEMRGTTARWNKLERTGVVSRGALADR